MFAKLSEVLPTCWPWLLLDAAVAYLLGSLSFAILVTRAVAHKDIRDIGSGNAGMTNVLRSQGGWPAVLTTLGDVGKSVAAVLFGGWLLCYAGLETALVGHYVAGLFCMLGHLFPVFFGFRGGKGVLVAFGMLLVMDWRVALLALAVFAVALVFTKMVSVGSLCAAVSTVPLTWIFDRLVRGWPMETALFCTVVTALMAGMIVFMHRSNIRRIRTHTERRLTFGKKEE